MNNRSRIAVQSVVPSLREGLLVPPLTSALRARRTLMPSCLSGALFLAVLIAATRPASSAGAAASRLDFNRDIRPILSDQCFACHGPDDAKRKAGLRLDLATASTQPLKSGAIPIVPGNPERSELVKRIQTRDEEDRMPPKKSGKELTPAQTETLVRWVKEGAEYQSHWAFVKPMRPALPTVSNPGWPRNGIDHFILARLDEQRAKPTPEADKTTLIRRVTLDLTGLPPTLAEVDAFLADTSEQAYEHLVDRLLSSPHFGERMAVDWLDAARYADTHGYHIDSGRDMTHWRDWVIQSYNDNKPFDQFTIEQLAGDLLPHPTLDQQIASGFNRNHMINYEGGAIPEEYHTAYLIDRVNTTSTVWLGLTMACAQCHDHKYDPITMKDYYRFFAFFNNIAEKGLDGSQGNAAPVVKVLRSEEEARLRGLEASVQAAEAKLKTIEDALPEAQANWEQTLVGDASAARSLRALQFHLPLSGSLAGTAGTQTIALRSDQPDWVPKWAVGLEGQSLELDGKEKGNLQADVPLNLEREEAFSYGAWIKPSGSQAGTLFSKMESGAGLRGFDLLVGDGRLHLHLIHSWPGNALRVIAKNPIPKDTWAHVFATYDGSGKASGVKLYVNGQESPVEVTNDTLSGSIANTAPFLIGRRPNAHAYKGELADVRIYGRSLESTEVTGLAFGPAYRVARIATEQRTESQRKFLTELFRTHQAPQWTAAKQSVAQARTEREKFEKTIPNTMVMGELEKPRETFMLNRGEYDKRGEKVEAGTPAALPALAPGLPSNRLGLARWLVSPEQPLTARVIVNRFWQTYFGSGLVRTSENFGSQADWPTHPELLDWLATEFAGNGWNIKAMQRLIVTSATYRQRSAVTAETLELDPENKLLTRGPRLRLSAEFIRDQALAISGLINPRIGGPSVFPYQPPGLWEELMAREDNDRFTAQKYVQSKGPDLYRRSLYTFWKRTSPPSTLGTLDAPDRQTCVVRRQRTNTPLQALLLMNDPTFVEASRKFAERLITEARNPEARIDLAYRVALSRLPTSSEKAVLLKLLDEQLRRYRRDRNAAAALLNVGDSAAVAGLDPAELAAWTLVTNAILNLDETITKS